MFKNHVSKAFQLTGLLLFFAVLIAPVHAEAPLIPLKDFFRNPEKANFSLSPNGEYLAFMMPWKNRMNVHVQKIGNDTITRITDASERDIMGYFWANDDRIVYIKDKGGDENFRLYAVNKNGGDPKDLTPFEEVKVQVIDILKDNEKEMIISMNRRNPQIFDVYRLNIITGKMDMIAENPGNITGWMTDHEGRLRLAITTDGVNTGILYRKKETDPFTTVITTNFKNTFTPVVFTYDNKNLYALSDLGRDKLAAVVYDLEHKRELKVLYEHPEVDLDNIAVSDKKRKVTCVTFITEKRNYYFFDEDRKKLQRGLEERLPGYEVMIASINRNEDKVLVRTYSDKSRGACYFYNIKTKEFRKLFDISPWLNEKDLADQKPIKYTSGDGLIIKGYLTLPQGVEAKNLPVVIFPHGGPWLRDTWGFNPEVQFLANRGYAVLQMNFRGSVGYGKSFWEKGFKEWGRKMQDDITDGVKWLIARGIADPKRIGIYGGSYGGYAVLAGLAFTPELYTCGVECAGIPNLITLQLSMPPYWKPYLEMLYEMVGDPEKDKELLTSTSPIFHVDKIKAPLLIAQGANDPRVPKAETDQMIEALKKGGVDVTYIVKENEGHGFYNEENRFEFFRAAEKFLGKYLCGRVEQNN